MTELFRPLVAVLVLALGLVAACAPPGPGEEPAELEIVDVDPIENLEVDLSGDRKAAPRAEGGGQLPSDFPAGMPVFKPSSIVDLGDRPGGRFVRFRARADEGTVKTWYLTSLEAAGWTVDTGPGGVLTASRGGASARISIDQPGPVTIVVVDY